MLYAFPAERLLAASEFDVFFDGEGNLVMTSNDRAAGGAVTYRTVGWTVKKEEKAASETASARVNQVEYSREVDPDDPTRVITTYKVSEDKLFERIKTSDPSWAKALFKNGGSVYLDAIMVVVTGGTPSGGINDDGSIWGTVYFTAESIKKAQDWTDPDSLDSHFGKEAYFEGDEEKLMGNLMVKYYEIEGADPDSEDSPSSQSLENAISLDFLGFDRSEMLSGEEYRIECADLSVYNLFFTYSTIYSVDKDGLTTKYCGQPVYNVDNSDLEFDKVEICFYYESGKTEESLSFSYGRDYVTEENRAELKAEPYEEPAFDVDIAIPSGEKLHVTCGLQKYYLNVNLKKYSGTRFVPVVVCVFHYDDGGIYHETKKKKYVLKDYSYYRIENARIFTAASSSVENGVLPETVRFEDISQPDIEWNMNRGSYVRTPEDPVKAYVSKDKYEEDGEASLINAAENACLGPEVRNDSLSVDGHMFLSGAWTAGETAGFSPPSGKTMLSLSKDDIQIPVNTANGNHETKAFVSYKKKRLGKNGVLSDTGDSVIFNIEKTNDVFIHTPVICVGRASDDRAGNQQSVCTSYNSLILGKNFTLGVSEEGRHIEAKGYGLKNYGSYSSEKQVRMPFPVYYGDKYVLPYTWVTLQENTAEFYLPIGVEEGDYEVEYRVFAANYEAGFTDQAEVNMSCDDYHMSETGSSLVQDADTATGSADQAAGASDGDSLTEEAVLAVLSEDHANKNSSHYIACDSLTVTVTGRMYDLTVTGVEDYPGWWSVFFTKLGVKKGVRYRVGRLSMEGEPIAERADDPLAPVMEKYITKAEIDSGQDASAAEITGSNTISSITTGSGSTASGTPQASIPGAGYGITFELRTIGSMRGDNDGIVMLPRYFHISVDGTKRTAVRLYSKKDLKEINDPIVLTAQNRSYIPVYGRNVYDSAVCEGSIQVWSGRYRLPDDVLAVSSDTDISRYIAQKGGRIRQDDSIFLKGGYILVQFEILSISDGSVNLSYINLSNAANGYCNMWKRQGFLYDRLFPNGQTVTFEDGDFLLFDMENTINSDYVSFGTH